MSVAGVAKLFLYKGQRVSVSGSAGQELNLALPPLFAVPRSAVCRAEILSHGAHLFPTPHPAMHVGSLKSATVGIFTPWKLSNVVNQGFPFPQHADC